MEALQIKTVHLAIPLLKFENKLNRMKRRMNACINCLEVFIKQGAL